MVFELADAAGAAGNSRGLRVHVAHSLYDLGDAQQVASGVERRVASLRLERVVAAAGRHQIGDLVVLLSAAEVQVGVLPVFLRGLLDVGQI